jgi:hypothetical protein
VVWQKLEIKIKDPKRLKKLAKEFHRTPTTFVNDIIDGFSYTRLDSKKMLRNIPSKQYCTGHCGVPTTVKCLRKKSTVFLGNTIIT